MQSLGGWTVTEGASSLSEDEVEGSSWLIVRGCGVEIRIVTSLKEVALEIAKEGGEGELSCPDVC